MLLGLRSGRQTIVTSSQIMLDMLLKLCFQSVKIRCFSKCTIDDMYFNLIPLLRKKPDALVLHVGTNNLSNETSFQIYDKLLNLVYFIKENHPNYHVVLSSPIDRLDDGKAALIIKRLNSSVYY